MNKLFCCCFSPKYESITDFQNGDAYHAFNDNDEDNRENVNKKVQGTQNRMKIESSDTSPDGFYRFGLRLKAQGDLDNAVHNFVQARKLGHPEAANAVNNTCYELGMKYKQAGEYEIAFEYFDICVGNAKSGEENGDALYELGHSYLCGRGTPQNKDEARRLIEMARQKGHRLAEMTLQIMDAPKDGSVSINIGGGSIGVSFN